MKISRVTLSVSKPAPQLIKLKNKVLNINIKIEILKVIKIQIITLIKGIIFFSISKNNQKTKNGKLIMLFRVIFLLFFLVYYQKNQ